MSSSTATAVPALSPPTVEAQTSHQRFIRDIFFTNLPLPVMKFRSYLWLAMLSRSLGPDGYGAWSLFQTTLDISISIGSMTLGGAMMRFLSGERTREVTDVALSSVYSANVTMGALIALLLTCLSGTLATVLFHASRYRFVILAVAGILISDLIFEQTRGFLRARRLNRNWAVWTLSRTIPEMLATVAFAALFKAAFAPILAYGVCSAIAAVMGLVYLVKRQQFSFVLPSWTVLRKYLRYGLALVPGSLAASLSFSADKFLVGHYLGLTQVGIYSVCFTVSALGFFLVGPANDVLVPELSALHEKRDWAAFDERFSGIQKFVFGAAMCATAVLVCFPVEVLRLIAAASFSSGSSALAILGMQGVFMSFVMLYEVLLKVRLRAWTSSAIWAGMGVIILAVDMVLIPRLGIIGAALSQLLSSLAGAAMVIGLCWSTFQRTFRLSWAIKAVAALVLLWCVTAFVLPQEWASAAPAPILIVGSCVYVILLLVSGYTNLTELSSVAKAVFTKGRA
jgi:O-antigen/teichoic acid export membrane protein